MNSVLKIKALVVDDEQHCLETLHWQLQRFCPQVVVVAVCSNAQEALDILKDQPIDLVFLDIEMPYMNGFEMLESIKPVNFEIIFTTAYDMFALKAFKFSALDYLLKPIDKDELLISLDKYQNRSAHLKPEQLDILFHSMSLRSGIQRIALPTMEGLEFVEVKNIIHCKSESNYTHIYLSSGKKLLISKTLKEIGELLSEFDFLRVHHSHLINLNHIRKYIKGDGGYVIMSNDDMVNVSRSRKELLLRSF
jgi:two-component system LytT family response regulator